MRTKTTLAVRLVTRVTRVTRVDSPKTLLDDTLSRVNFAYFSKNCTSAQKNCLDEVILEHQGHRI